MTKTLAPMRGLLERSGFGSIPVAYRGTTGGINGVVANLNWGDLMVNTPAAYPAFTDGIGSTNFNTDRGIVETSSTGPGSMAAIINNLNGVSTGLWNGTSNPSQKLVAGSQVKLRFFSSVGAVPNFANPPAPAWLTTMCGHFTSADSFHNIPYWVNGTVLAGLSPSYSQQSGDVVCSPINGLQYVAQKAIANGSNTVDPSTVAPNANWKIQNATFGAPGYGPGAGPVVTWFGNNASKYLAAWAYFQLIMANCRVYVDNPAWANPGDSGTWHAGQLVGSGVQFTLDTCPMIGEVTMSACTTIYGECCIRQISGNPAVQYTNITRPATIAAGYTFVSGLAAGHSAYNGSPTSLGVGTLVPFAPAADSDVGQIIACQSASAAAWTHTCISEAHNPFQVVGGSDQTSSHTDMSVTDALIANLIKVCAAGQAVPGNNSVVGDPTILGGLLAHVAAQGGPLYFQTDVAGKIIDAGKTVAQVIAEIEAVGAFNLELPAGNYTVGGNPTSPAGLFALSQAMLAYIAAGTGPTGITTTFPNGATLASNVAYSDANTRNATGAPVWSAISPPATATDGTLYTNFYTVAASGSGNTYMVTSGSLPNGLTLNATSGVISGTPTTAGLYSFVITASNSSGLNADSGTLSITIATPVGAPLIVNASPPDGVLGQLYSYTFTVSNPTGVTWAPGSLRHLSGLPPGLGPIDPTTGIVSGTPTGVPGVFTFAVTATNSSGASTTLPLTINIVDPFPIAQTRAAQMFVGGVWKNVRIH